MQHKLQSRSQAGPDRPRFHLFRSLKTRLRWSYALASFIPLALLGALLINTSFRTQRQNTYNGQQTAADWVAREVGNSLSALDERLLAFGDRLRPELSAAELQEVVARLREVSPEIIDIAVLDATGRERAHNSRLRVYNDAELRDRASDPLVQWVLQTGRVAQGQIDKLEDGTLIYPSYAPLFSGDGRVIGAIRAEVDSNQIARTLREAPLTPGSYAYLVRDNGGLQLAADPRGGIPPELPDLLHSPETIHEYAGS